MVVQNLVHWVQVAGGLMERGKGIRAGQGGIAPHEPEPDSITGWVCCHSVYHMAEGSFVPGNTVSPRVDEVNNYERELTSDSEIT